MSFTAAADLKRIWKGRGKSFNPDRDANDRLARSNAGRPAPKRLNTTAQTNSDGVTLRSRLMNEVSRPERRAGRSAVDA